MAWKSSRPRAQVLADKEAERRRRARRILKALRIHFKLKAGA